MSLYWVALAGLGFVGTHLGISSTPLRALLMQRLGTQGYLGFYSLLAFVTLGLLIWAYTNTPHVPLLWAPLTLVPKLLMPLALLFIVGGFTVPNPTSVGAEAKVGGDAARGMLRITRHPVQWGLLLWAASHLLANTDVASIVFFGSMAAVSVFGMLAMDNRKASLDSWPAFAAVTSTLPLGAIVSGRNQLVLRELALPFGIAVVLTILLWWLHPYLSGGMPLL